MSNDVKVKVISNKDYKHYKHFFQEMKGSDISGLVVVKSLKLNNLTKQYQEYAIALTY